MTRFSRMRHDTATARRLRKRPTDAEARLWARLRRWQLGVSFRRQHPAAGYVLDFYAPALKLAIELDGGQHAAAGNRDSLRTRALTARGVSVLRFWNDEVLENPEGVVVAILGVLRNLSAQTPSPALPLAGGGSAGGTVALEVLRLEVGETGA